MRVFTISLVFFINMILQSTVYEYVEVFSVRPNTALILVVSYAILRGDVEGAIVGFFVGLLQDAYFGQYIGLHALLCMLAGFACGKPFRNFYRESYLQPMVLVCLTTLVYEFVFYCSTFLFHGRLDLLFYMRKIILPETVYATLLSIPVYRLLYSINKRLESREWSRRKRFQKL